MNRSDAKMIAEELHKFIRNDVRKAVTIIRKSKCSRVSK